MRNQQVASSQRQTDAGGDGVVFGGKFLLGSAVIGVEEPTIFDGGDAKYLQELAWKVYRREIKNTRPAQ